MSTPFNTYQQAFIAAKPSARYCITFNSVSFDRVIHCWILSFTIYIMNSWHQLFEVTIGFSYASHVITAVASYMLW